MIWENVFLDVIFKNLHTERAQVLRWNSPMLINSGFIIFVSLYSDQLVSKRKREGPSVLFLYSVFPNPNLNIKLKLTAINYSPSLNAKTIPSLQNVLYLKKLTALLKEPHSELECNSYVVFLSAEFLLFLEMQPVYCLLWIFTFIIYEDHNVFSINHFLDSLVCQSVARAI